MSLVPSRLAAAADAGGRGLVLFACLAASTAAESRAGVPAFESQILHADPFLAGDAFGAAVAISGDTAVIGAPEAEGEHPLVGTVPAAGAAYVFVRTGGAWVLQARLVASDGFSFDLFGRAVAIDGDTIVVGAEYDDNTAGIDAGSAYVFTRSGATWTEVAHLVPSQPAATRFAETVAIDGATIVVGSRFDTFGGLEQAGRAAVYVRTGSEWVQQALLSAADPAPFDWFGGAVSIAGESIACGSSARDGALLNTGAVYVFERSGSAWSQVARLEHPAAEQADQLGGAVALEGDTCLAGALGQAGANGADAGAVHVFQRSGGEWTHRQVVAAPAASLGVAFGTSIALRGATALVGSNSIFQGSAHLLERGEGGWSVTAELAPELLGSAFGFGRRVALGTGLALVGAADDASLGVADAGAAYAFSIPQGAWQDLGFALAGGPGEPLFAGSGALLGGTPGGLELANAAPNAAAVLFLSHASQPVALLGGTLAAFPVAVALPLATGAEGGFALTWAAWPAGLPSGLALYFQCAIADAGAPAGAAFSNALRATLP